MYKMILNADDKKFYIYSQQNPWILILFLKYKDLCPKEIVASIIQLVKGVFKKKNWDLFCEHKE